MQPVRIMGMRPAWGLPSPSPFCLKLETWLRIADIPYQAITLDKPPRSSTGKVPYLLREDGGTLADSNVIIRTLARERGIAPDPDQTPEQRARAHAVLRLVEESLYFAAVWERWMLPAAWPVTRDGYFGQLPGPLRTLFAGLVRRKVKAALHGQGILRLAPDEIAARGAADVLALSALLGERSCFQGERPGIADAAVYGLLANALGFPVQTPLRAAVQACPNLLAFCGRIREAYWSGAAAPAGVNIADAAVAHAA